MTRLDPTVPFTPTRPLLEVKNLTTRFRTERGTVTAVDGVSFHVDPGETLAIVGESGCGKSMTALSLMRLIPDPPGRIVGGSVKLAGTDLVTLDESAMRRVRGKEIFLFSQPRPVRAIHRQDGWTPERLAETFRGTLGHHLVPLEGSAQYFSYDPLV